MLAAKFAPDLNTDLPAKSFASGTSSRTLRILFALAVLTACPALAYGKTAAEWDFTKGTLGWTPNARVKELISTPQGLLVRSTGEDPWIEGPAVDLPGVEMTRVKIRMKSNADTGAEVFYGRAFSAGKSVRFTVRNDGKWHDYSVVISARLGGGTRFRLDPCMDAGEVTVAFIKVGPIGEITLPSLPIPKAPNKSAGSPLSVKSGPIELVHYKGKWGNFTVKVNGAEMACGHQDELIGLVFDGQPQWLNLKDAKVTFQNRRKGSLTTTAVVSDARGAKWEIQRRIKPGPQGTLLVETRVKVDKDRDVVHIPWLTLFPGLGTFGRAKYQGLFAGLEYLCDEPSSSEADIAEPKHIRRVPDPVKITFPLMAIAHNGSYVGIIWEPSDMTAAVFDSPDRIYDSGAHIMALTGPAVGEHRFENALCAHTPFRLEADKPLKVSATIIAGKGRTVVGAVRRYVELKGLPDVPKVEGGLAAAVNLLAHGWLDSQINHDGLFRHAVWGSSFGPQPAADASMYIDWLTGYVEDKNLRERLNVLKARSLGKIPAGQAFSGTIGHAHIQSAPFVFGRVNEFVRQKRDAAFASLRRFDENGVMQYRAGKADYSKTHFAKHANGLAGRTVVNILEGAAFSADAELIAKALELLDKQTALYAETVPRGAQTWEVPLHTPDILASAHMVKSYTIAYIISGKEQYLEQARYWAWTGVPFVYLYPPTTGRVGPYSTIAVLGATNWQAPVWFGRPVQWCGLAYCSALHFLSGADPKGPWAKIAKGITAAGLQMTWPTTDKERQGLLPDFFELKPQIPAGPAINPGTVQAHLPELYDRGKIYDIARLPAHRWFIHAPCKIRQVKEEQNAVSLIVEGWAHKQYHVLISGIEKEPKQVLARNFAQTSTEPAPLKPAQTRFHPDTKLLVITLTTPAEIQIEVHPGNG